MSIEVPVSARILSQEELGQSPEDHWWFSYESTCTTSVFHKDIDGRPCSHNDLSNKRTTSSGERRSEECRSGNGHLEWSPRIMEFIHSMNVCQKEVITFSRLWEEEEARLIREDGSNWRSISHHQKKIPQSMRNMKISTLEELLIHLSIWIRNDAIMKKTMKLKAQEGVYPQNK